VISSVVGRSHAEHRLSSHLRGAEWLIVGALAWGALAFGAVYSWAFWPLIAVLTLVGVSGLFSGLRPDRQVGMIAAAFGLVGLAVLIQLVPLPLGVLAIVSPDAPRLLHQLSFAAAEGIARSHPISIAPGRTWIGLLLFTGFAVFTIAATMLLAETGAARISRYVIVIGVVLAIVGIVQKPLFTGLIYGLWRPEGRGEVFGPFVNRNHFAGWMVMAIPLALGLLCCRMSRELQHVKPDWHSRLLWLASSEGNGAIVLGGSVLLMTLSLGLTLSRSGIAALLLSLVFTGAIVARRSPAGARKALIAYLGFLVAAVGTWTGTDALVTRLEALNESAISRWNAWEDAAAVVSRYELVGTGLNTYGVAMLIYQKHDLAWHYAEAHNDYLQLAAEGGALVAMPALACVVVFGMAVRRRFRDETSQTTYWLRVGAVTGLIAIACQEAVEFSLQMPGNAALFALLCAIALHRTPPRRARIGAADEASAPYVRVP
jgi:O-antigen ligase